MKIRYAQVLFIGESYTSVMLIFSDKSTLGLFYFNLLPMSYAYMGLWLEWSGTWIQFISSC